MIQVPRRRPSPPVEPTDAELRHAYAAVKAAEEALELARLDGKAAVLRSLRHRLSELIAEAAR